MTNIQSAYFKNVLEQNALKVIDKPCQVFMVSSPRFSQVAGTKKIGKNSFRVRFNPNKLKDTNHILHVALHELGHIVHWVDIEDNIMSEYLAESWALLVAKQFYPNEYSFMVERTRENIFNISSFEHKIGYIEALRSIGEWKDG